MPPQPQSQSIAAQAADLAPEDFKNWITKRQYAVDTILNAVIETVGGGNIEPVAGARIAACVTGSVFGYEEFHPRAGSLPAEQMLDADLLTTVGNRERQLA